MLSQFKRGRAVYTCDYCGKRTRDTGIGETDNFLSGGLCAKCYDEGGWEIEHMDSGSDHNGEGPQPNNCPTCRGREWWK